MDNRRGAKPPELIRHHARTYDPLVTKADQWIRANLDRDIRVQDVAKEVAVSMRTLMRRFKDSTGESPQGYLQRLRLETAKTLLANSPGCSSVRSSIASATRTTARSAAC